MSEEALSKMLAGFGKKENGIKKQVGFVDSSMIRAVARHSAGTIIIP